MTPQTPAPRTIPADKVRDLRDQYMRLIEDAGTKEAQAYYGHVVDDLDALLPSPPTLADMTPEARRDCQWMQADIIGGDEPLVITRIDRTDWSAVILDRNGRYDEVPAGAVTPRPDLPRLEWPGTGQDGEEATKVDYVSVAGGRTAYGPWTVARLRKKADPAPAPALPEGWRLADHPVYGRVIVTNTTPTRSGHVYFALPDGDDPLGYDWDSCTPDELTYIDADQEADTSDAVPENTLAVGSVWDDADALAQACRESESDHIVVVDKQGTVGVWDKGIRCWRVSAPHAKFAPYTIIHTGKKAHQ